MMGDHQCSNHHQLVNGTDGAVTYYLTSSSSGYSNSGGTTPLLRTSPEHTSGQQQPNGDSDRCRFLSAVLLVIRCSYLSILLLKLFLKFTLIPWLFFHKKPYGDLNNVSMETVTLFLWLVLIYMTIFIIIGIIGILDDNLYLITCFLFLMDMEIIICLYNDYIEINTRTIIMSTIIIALTSVYMSLVFTEKRLLRKHRHEHPVNYVQCTVYIMYSIQRCLYTYKNYVSTMNYNEGINIYVNQQLRILITLLSFDIIDFIDNRLVNTMTTKTGSCRT